MRSSLMCRLLLTPYSSKPLPHSEQNSRCSNVPEPLSASCTLTRSCPALTDQADFGILVVMPNGPPVNFCDRSTLSSILQFTNMPFASTSSHWCPYLAISTMAQAGPCFLVCIIQSNLISDFCTVATTRINHLASHFGEICFRGACSPTVEVRSCVPEYELV